MAIQISIIMSKESIQNEIKYKAFLGAYEHNLDDAIQKFKGPKAGVDFENFLQKMEESVEQWLGAPLIDFVLHRVELKPNKVSRASVYLNLSLIKSWQHNMDGIGADDVDLLPVSEVKSLFEQAVFISVGFAILTDMLFKNKKHKDNIDKEIDAFVKKSMDEISTDDLMSMLGLGESTDNQE